MRSITSRSYRAAALQRRTRSLQLCGAHRISLDSRRPAAIAHTAWLSWMNSSSAAKAAEDRQLKLLLLLCGQPSIQLWPDDFLSVTVGFPQYDASLAVVFVFDVSEKMSYRLIVAL